MLTKETIRKLEQKYGEHSFCYQCGNPLDEGNMKVTRLDRDEVELITKQIRAVAFKEAAEWLEGLCKNVTHHPKAFPYPRRACHRCVADLLVALKEGRLPNETL